MSENNQQFDNSILEKFAEVGEVYVNGLKKNIDESGKLFKISDIIDESGNQYVNLVQQGGGVLGIALLGYTYVLERMGIRFLKVAGTSAGAINSTLISIIRNDDPKRIKSLIILHYLLSKNLFDLVDGNKIAKWLIKKTINYKDYSKSIINSSFYLLFISLSLIITGILFTLNDSGNSVIAIAQSMFLFSLVFSAFMLPRNRRIVLQYITGYSFIVIFISIILVLIVAYTINIKLLSCNAFMITSVIILTLVAYSLNLIFKNKHLRIVQISIILILINVYLSCLINNYESVRSFFDSYIPLHSLLIPKYLPNHSLSYGYLTIAGLLVFIYFLLGIGGITVFLYAKFNGSKFGINPGNSFKSWISEFMVNGKISDSNNTDSPILLNLKSGEILEVFNSANEIHTLVDLENRLKDIPKIIYSSSDNTQYSLTDNNPLYGLNAYDSNEPSLAIIATEIMTENKIIFPKMWKLFYRDENDINPADFVRASMSIPIFFEAFRIKNVPKRSERESEWMKYLRYDGNDIGEAVFIDGGSLSNFPINVFNPVKASTPRLPTFGARLIDEDVDSKKPAHSLLGIIGSIINTMRYYYDKDFLINHPHYEKCLTDIDVRGFNWLDFSLPIDEQLELFKKGAQAAKEFLSKFDWEQYKLEQEALKLGAPPSDIRIANDSAEIDRQIQLTKNNRGIN